MFGKKHPKRDALLVLIASIAIYIANVYVTHEDLVAAICVAAIVFVFSVAMMSAIKN